MMMTRALGIVIALAVLGTAGRLEAQAQRVDYLVRMLQTSDQFRVRAQAAISLGRVEASEPIVTALGGALADEHPAVRTAAAASLERLADPSALGALRGAQRDRDAGVRRAVTSAIRVLERVARTTPRRDAGDGGGPTPSQNALYYVGVGQPGARDGSVDAATLRRAKELLTRLVGEVEGVEVAPENESNAAATRVIQRRRLTGYYIDSSVVSLSNEGGNTRAVVSVILNTYPGRDMRAILQGSATVPGATGPAAREQALEGALRGAMRRLPQAMASSRR
ncbi:MAG: HEAT repeat domain-containing protein [Myxococcales bacterium]|nr:HEAT repeat domain-containing protein [Myxococcales bacterium]